MSGASLKIENISMQISKSVNICRINSLSLKINKSKYDIGTNRIDFDHYQNIIHVSGETSFEATSTHAVNTVCLTISYDPTSSKDSANTKPIAQTLEFSESVKLKRNSFKTFNRRSSILNVEAGASDKHELFISKKKLPQLSFMVFTISSQTQINAKDFETKVEFQCFNSNTELANRARALLKLSILHQETARHKKEITISQTKLEEKKESYETSVKWFNKSKDIFKLRNEALEGINGLNKRSVSLLSNLHSNITTKTFGLKTSVSNAMNMYKHIEVLIVKEKRTGSKLMMKMKEMTVTTKLLIKNITEETININNKKLYFDIVLKKVHRISKELSKLHVYYRVLSSIRKMNIKLKDLNLKIFEIKRVMDSEKECIRKAKRLDKSRIDNAKNVETDYFVEKLKKSLGDKSKSLQAIIQHIYKEMRMLESKTIVKYNNNMELECVIQELKINILRESFF